MKRLITILLLAISGFASAQYQLNYADIRIGNLTSKTSFRGNNILMPYITLGTLTDSVLTIAGGRIYKVPRSQFSGGGSGAVSSVFGRTGDVVAQSSDYDPFYPLLAGTYNNPTWINTLAYSKITGVPAFITTETDPTVPAYAKSLTAFSDIKTSTDALYEPIITSGIAAQYIKGNKTLGTFQTDVSANTDVAANTAVRHSAVTIGTANGLSLAGQVLSMGLSSSGVTGALSGSDWNTFNSKQNQLVLTTLGTSGTASLIGNTLNIPNYATGGGAGSSALRVPVTLASNATLIQITWATYATDYGVRPTDLSLIELSATGDRQVFTNWYSDDNGVTYKFDVAPETGSRNFVVVISGGSTVTSGNVTSVTSANGDISVTNSTTTPVLTLNSGMGANQIVKRNGSGVIADLAPYSLDANVVHNTGNETITGIKTFNSATYTQDIFSTKLNTANGSSGLYTQMVANEFQYANNGFLLSLTAPTLTASKSQGYQDDNGIIALTKNFATGQNIGANTTGSAATLTTTRTIWGQNFNGSGNVNGALSGATTINASGIITGSSFSGAGTGLTGTAASLTSGNATKLSTARTIGTTGITSTPATFDGSANANIAVTAVPASLLTGTASINTTGDAATWASNGYNGALPSSMVTFLMTYSNVDNNWHYATPSQIKTGLSTTLQDVITAGNIATTSPIFRTNLIVENSSASDSRLSMAYDGISNSMRISSTYNTTGSYLPLTFFTADNERMRMLPNGNVLVGLTTPVTNAKLEVNGKATVSSAPTNPTDVVRLQDLPVSSSGTYTPTISNTTNVTSSSANQCFYTRQGNIVTVYGSASITPTSATNTRFHVSLPPSLPATDFISDADLSGIVSGDQFQYGFVIGSPSLDTADMRALFTSTPGTYRVTFNFQYIIK